jgi:hypothetical protein
VKGIVIEFGCQANYQCPPRTTLCHLSYLEIHTDNSLISGEKDRNEKNVLIL